MNPIFDYFSLVSFFHVKNCSVKKYLPMLGLCEISASYGSLYSSTAITPPSSLMIFWSCWVWFITHLKANFTNFFKININIIIFLGFSFYLDANSHNTSPHAYMSTRANEFFSKVMWHSNTSGAIYLVVPTWATWNYTKN